MIALARLRVGSPRSARPLLERRFPSPRAKLAGALALLAALPASGGRAQSVTGLEPGARVRVAAEAVAPKRMVGTLVRLDADSMQLRLSDVDELARVPREAITKVEISRGRRSRGRGALYGALAGLAVGAGAVLATPRCEEPDCWEIFSKGEGAALVGGLGAGLGALVGLAIPPGEKWESVPIAQISVVPGRRGYVGVSLSFGF
jgi:hypothetical protein